MSISIRDSGVWKEPEMLSVKDAGVWKELSGGTGLIAPGMRAEGGVIVGFFVLGSVANGVFALVLADKSSEVSLQWKTSGTATSGTNSTYDGWANTNNMNDSNHPAAQYCRSYGGGGYNDWYLPSREEGDLCYRVFKPGTTSNNGNITNPYCLPPVGSFTSNIPPMTWFPEYQSGNPEAFEEDGYWCSTSTQASTAVRRDFDNGSVGTQSKTMSFLVRPVRRVRVY